MDHLHYRHARKRIAEPRISSWLNRVDELQRVDPRSALLRDYRLSRRLAREEKSGNSRGNARNYLRNQLLLYRSRSARHTGYEAERGCSVVYREPHFVGARDAAHLDARRNVGSTQSPWHGGNMLRPACARISRTQLSHGRQFQGRRRRWVSWICYESSGLSCAKEKNCGCFRYSCCCCSLEGFSSSRRARLSHHSSTRSSRWAASGTIDRQPVRRRSAAAASRSRRGRPHCSWRSHLRFRSCSLVSSKPGCVWPTMAGTCRHSRRPRYFTASISSLMPISRGGISRRTDIRLLLRVMHSWPPDPATPCASSCSASRRLLDSHTRRTGHSPESFAMFSPTFFRATRSKW